MALEILDPNKGIDLLPGAKKTLVSEEECAAFDRRWEESIRPALDENARRRRASVRESMTRVVR